MNKSAIVLIQLQMRYASHSQSDKHKSSLILRCQVCLAKSFILIVAELLTVSTLHNFFLILKES